MLIRARFENGILRPLTNHPIGLSDGEIVSCEIDRQRSMKSHRHQFAWINDAWANLPERLMLQPWAETPETMRKHALIATGYHQLAVIDCGSNAAAGRVKAALVAAESRAHGYALGQVRGPVVRVWTPESQSVRAMGSERFKESKRAILDWMAGQLEVDPADLERAQ